ncbi:hypothetical protein GCM10028864_41850 [Microlunatus parietis]
MTIMATATPAMAIATGPAPRLPTSRNGYGYQPLTAPWTMISTTQATGQISASRPVRRSIRGRGPNAIQQASTRIGATTWSSLSVAYDQPSRSSSGRRKNQCTSPVMIIPITAASRSTRQNAPSRSGLITNETAATAASRLLWIVK